MQDCLSLAASATWRFEDNIICKDFRKPIDVVGVECFRPFLERLPRRNRPESGWYCVIARLVGRSRLLGNLQHRKFVP